MLWPLGAGELWRTADRTDGADVVRLAVGRHGVVRGLFEPEFLKKARQEIVSQISFREKETDICKQYLESPTAQVERIHPPSATFPR